MDSKEYFARAEKANRNLRLAILVILLVVVVAQFGLIFLFYRNNIDNHKLGAENQKIINSNFEAYFKCLTDDSYKIPQGTRPTQAQADKILNDCAKANTQELKS